VNFDAMNEQAVELRDVREVAKPTTKRKKHKT
jgi:hypothetical protein